MVGLIVVHVDDFEYCGTLSSHDNIINKIVRLFKISKKEKRTFRYTGLDIGSEIFVAQQAYINGLQEIQIDNT